MNFLQKESNVEWPREKSRENKAGKIEKIKTIGAWLVHGASKKYAIRRIPAGERKNVSVLA